MQDPNFWNDTEQAGKISQSLKSNPDPIKEYESMQAAVEDFEVLLELVREEDNTVYGADEKLGY